MKNIKIIFLILVVGILSFSCNGDDDADLSGSDVNGNITFVRNISEFDINKNLDFSLLSSDGVTFDEIKVYEGSTEIATATIDNATETATINSSSLGDFNFPGDEDEDGDDKTGAYAINTVSKLSNGNSFLNNFTVRVKKELTMDEEVASVIFGDTLKTTISIDTRTSIADLDFVKVFWKKNYNGTYVEDTSYTFDDNNKKIEFQDVVDMTTAYSLAVNDTLYYKFTTQKGALTDDVTTTIGIDAQVLKDEYTGSINNGSENIYNFDDNNIITYASPYGFSLNAMATMKFVSSNISYDSDIFTVKDTFDNGTEVTSLSNLSEGDIFVYKIVKTILEGEEGEEIEVDKTFYGIAKIESIVLVNGTDETINFKYKEGFIIGE